MLRLLAVLLSFGFALAGQGEGVTLTAQFPSGVRQVTVVCTTAGGREAARWKVDASSPTTKIVSEEPCRLSIAERDVWLEPVWLEPNASSATLVLHRAVPLRARLTEPAPRAVRIRLTRTDGSPGPVTVDETCAVREGQVDCVVPLGTFDVAVYAEGRVTQFLWNVAIREPAADLGTIRLVEGSSISGRVVANAMTDVEIGVTRVGTPDAARKTAPNAKGWFQLTGLIPGEYELRARGRDGWSSTAERVRVMPNGQVELRNALVLTAPRRIRVFAAPPKDPWGEPWRVRLSTAGEQGRVVAESAVDATGEWKSGALHGDDYTITVSSAQHGVWHDEHVALAATDREIGLVLTSYEVRGTIEKEDRGVGDAEGFIGGRFGAVRQRFATDAEGRFSTFVPSSVAHAGEWTVALDAPAANIHRVVKARPVLDEEGSRVSVSIRLPSRRIEGRVTRHDRSAAANATINVLDAAAQTSVQQIRAADDGHFAIEGLDAGRYFVTAAAYLAESETQEIAIAADDRATPPIHLVLQPNAVLHGRVTSPFGPVPGAVVLAIPSGVSWTTVTQRATEADGSFVTKLPPGTAAADLIVVAPGFPAAIHHVFVDGRAIEIAVSPNGGGALRLTVPVLTDAVAESLFLTRNDARVGVVFLLSTGAAKIVQQSGAEVTIEVPSVEQGTYTLCLGAQCRSSYVAPRAERALRVALAP
jgi:hypothetical protein